MMAAAPMLLLLGLTGACVPDAVPPAEEPGPDPVPLIPGDPIERLDVAAPVIEVEDVERIGDIAWACSNSDGLVSVDLSDPSALRILTQWNVATPRCDHLALDGDLIYIASHPLMDDGLGWLATADGSDPENPEVIEQLFAPFDPEGLTVHDGELLIAALDDGLIAADPGPGWPERGRVQTARAMQVRAAGGLAYVADGEEGLVVIDIATLTRRGSLPLGGNPADLDLSGNRAVVALGGAGVALVDISDPEGPALLDLQDTPGSALGVSVSGELVWVSDWLDLRLFQIVEDRLVFVAREAIPFEIVPPPVDPNLPNYSMGVTAWADTALSSNWTEFASYRAHPDRGAGDLVLQPRLLRLPRTASGTSSTAALVLRNEGRLPLTVDSAQIGGGFELLADLPLTLEPGAAQGTSLRFDASSNGPRREVLTLLSDDVDQPQLPLTVLANAQGLAVGDSVPDVSFLGLDGAPVQLADRLGGGPLLLAYFATF